MGKLKQELPAIMQWMVQGCAEWQRSGLAPPAKVCAAPKNIARIQTWSLHSLMNAVGDNRANEFQFRDSIMRIKSGRARDANIHWQ